MAINPINNSTLRLIGLSSGMDTDSIVKQMLRIHQLKIDSQFRSKTLLQWKQESLTTVRNQISDFRLSFLTTQGANQMLLSSAYNSTVATLTGKNSSAVSVKTSTNTVPGSLTIGQIYSLASKTKAVTEGKASANGEGFKLTDKLIDIRTAAGKINFNSAGEAKVNIDGTNITLKNTDKLDDINNKLRAQHGNEITFYDDQKAYNTATGLTERYARVSFNGMQTIVFESDFVKETKLGDAITFPKNEYQSVYVEFTSASTGSRVGGMVDINKDGEFRTGTFTDVGLTAHMADGIAFDMTIGSGTGAQTFVGIFDINGPNVSIEKTDLGKLQTALGGVDFETEGYIKGSVTIGAWGAFSGDLWINKTGELHSDTVNAILDPLSGVADGDAFEIKFGSTSFTGTVNINGSDVTLNWNNAPAVNAYYDKINWSTDSYVKAGATITDSSSAVIFSDDVWINSAGKLDAATVKYFNDNLTLSGDDTISITTITGTPVSVTGSLLNADGTVNADGTLTDVRKKLAAIDFGIADTITVDGVTLSKDDTLDVISAKLGKEIVFQDEGNGVFSANLGKAVINGADTDIKIYRKAYQKTFAETGIADRTGNSTIGGASRAINFQDGKYTVTINGKQIELNSTMTIGDMINTVNSSNAGVTMSYNRAADQFVIENMIVGSTQLTTGGLEVFGIYSGDHRESLGSWAEVDINGQKVRENSNTFKYGDVEITLNSVSLKTGAEPYEDTIVSLKYDATGAIEKIRGFVDAYNTLIKRLEDLISERKSRDEISYKPLTDEEKSLMSDKQIEEWETIAKKALLKNDSSLQSLTFSLRSLLYEQVAAAGLTPAQIGLGTGSWFDGKGGQIVLDEVKLRSVLESNPDVVMGVFIGSTDVDVTGENGFLHKMDSLMYGYYNGSNIESLNSLDTSIRRSNEQIDKLQKKMWEEEEKLYKKFAAMETALSKIQSQADWLTAMLGMNNSNNNNR